MNQSSSHGETLHYKTKLDFSDHQNWLLNEITIKNQ